MSESCASASGGGSSSRTRSQAIRVLVLSHTYFPAHYRGKLRALHDHPEVSLTLGAIPRMRAGAATLAYEHSPADLYPQHLLSSLFRSHNILRLYDPVGLIRLLRRVDPCIVHIEVEPHGLALMQIVLLRATFGYRVLFFSWENIYRPLPPPLAWVERFNLARADAALCGNTEAEAVLRRRGFRGRIDVVPQIGMDPAICDGAVPSPQWASLRARGPVIGFVGRLVAYKGLEDLVEAFIKLQPSSAGEQWGSPQLLLVGEGPLRGAIRARLAEASIENRAHFAGRVPYREVPSHLKCMDVLVLPSRTSAKWKEQFGHVLIEAMACSVPVIGSDSGAIPEVIGDAGLTFPEGDVDGLAKRLEQVLTNGTLRDRLALSGRRRFLSRYTDQVIGEKTLSAYRRLAAA